VTGLHSHGRNQFARSTIGWIATLCLVAGLTIGPVLPAFASNVVAAAWGANESGQIGDGSTQERDLPTGVLMPPGVTFTQISAGYAFTLALASDGTAWAWGNNVRGQLGDGTTINRSSPVPVQMPVGVTFVQVSAGARHSVALASDGTAWTWGWNSFGQLGDGTKTNRLAPVPVQMPPGVTFVQVSAGAYHVLGLTADGTMWGWGNNSYYQEGGKDSGNHLTPVQILMKTFVPMTAVSAGVYHSMSLDTSGKVWVWGSNFYGESGKGSRTPQQISKPLKAKTPKRMKFTSISAGYYTSYAVNSKGKAYAWGANYTGQLGDGTTTDHLTPAPVQTPIGLRLNTISGGFYHAIAVARDGTAWAWGRNTRGELGDGTTDDRYSPVMVLIPAGTTTTQVDGGGLFTAALLSSTGSSPMLPAREASRPTDHTANSGAHRERSDNTNAMHSSQAPISVQSTDWTKYRFDLANTGYNPLESTLDPSNVSQLKQKWQVDLNTIAYSSPAIVNGIVYVTSDNGKLHALDAQTGNQIWVAQTNGWLTDSAPAVADGIVYVASDSDVGGLFAYDAATGAPLWTADTGGPVNSSPSVANGILYIGSFDGSLYAFDPHDGTQLWYAPTGGGIIDSSPAVVNGVVYIGSGNSTVIGTMNAYDAQTGRLQWVATAGDLFTATPAVSNGVVYAGSQDGHMYAWDAATGAQLWTALSAMFVFTPAVANGVVYVGAHIPDLVYALDATTGATLWTANAFGVDSAGPVVANGVVYVGSSSGAAFAFDAGTGAELWGFGTSGYISASPSVCDGVVYVASQDHHLYAFSLPS
jgi:outer membrane protein assembly factor BamB